VGCYCKEQGLIVCISTLAFDYDSLNNCTRECDFIDSDWSTVFLFTTNSTTTTTAAAAEQSAIANV
jgi:hypothetical protein